MPVYVFEKADGQAVELVLSYDELTERQFTRDRKQFIKLEDGTEARRIYVPCGGMASSVWPKRSLAAGVAPEQVKEAMDNDRRAGIPTEYDPKTGDAIYTSAAHQRRHLRAHGLVDRDAFI